MERDFSVAGTYSQPRTAWSPVIQGGRVGAGESHIEEALRGHAITCPQSQARAELMFPEYGHTSRCSEQLCT